MWTSCSSPATKPPTVPFTLRHEIAQATWNSATLSLSSAAVATKTNPRRECRENPRPVLTASLGSCQVFARPAADHDRGRTQSRQAVKHSAPSASPTKVLGVVSRRRQSPVVGVVVVSRQSRRRSRRNRQSSSESSIVVGVVSRRRSRQSESSTSSSVVGVVVSRQSSSQSAQARDL